MMGLVVSSVLCGFLLINKLETNLIFPVKENIDRVLLTLGGVVSSVGFPSNWVNEKFLSEAELVDSVSSSSGLVWIVVLLLLLYCRGRGYRPTLRINF